MKLLLVRHGRSIANHQKMLQDKKDEWYDTPLHELGINQAKEIANKLKNEKIDKIYSSPLKRALQTAEEINKYHNLKIKTTKKIVEKKQKESTRMFVLRCLRFFNRIKKKNKTILVVTHNGVILSLLGISTQSRKKGEQLARENLDKIQNASLTIIEKQGKEYVPLQIGST